MNARGLALAASAILLLLAACGVDGKPIPPDDRDKPKSGVTISGSVNVGVAGGSGMGTRPVTSLSN